MMICGAAFESILTSPVTCYILSSVTIYMRKRRAMSEHTLSISEAQKELMRLPEQFEEQPEAVTVTRYGKPVMSILPYETHRLMLETIDSLLETIEILQDAELMATFRESVKELAAGQGQPLDDVLKELGWE